MTDTNQQKELKSCRLLCVYLPEFTKSQNYSLLLLSCTIKPLLDYEWSLIFVSNTRESKTNKHAIESPPMSGCKTGMLRCFTYPTITKKNKRQLGIANLV